MYITLRRIFQVEINLMYAVFFFVRRPPIGVISIGFAVHFFLDLPLGSPSGRGRRFVSVFVF